MLSPPVARLPRQLGVQRTVLDVAYYPRGPPGLGAYGIWQDWIPALPARGRELLRYVFTRNPYSSTSPRFHASIV